jgi:hypothetical protein
VAVVAVVTSLFALVVSVFSAWYARRQTKAAERQAEANEEAVRLQHEILKSQSEQTASALQIAERSAIAAEQSAMSTKTLVETGQRAWLVVERIAPLVDATCRFQVPNRCEVHIRNGGNTPAMNVLMDHFILATSPLTDEVGFPDPAPHIARGVIGAQATDVHWTRGPSQEIEPHIASGTHHLVDYGRLWYHDVFGNKHETTWCYKWVHFSRSFHPHLMQHNAIT